MQSEQGTNRIGETRPTVTEELESAFSDTTPRELLEPQSTWFWPYDWVGSVLEVDNVSLLSSQQEKEAYYSERNTRLYGFVHSYVSVRNLLKFLRSLIPFLQMCGLDSMNFKDPLSIITPLLVLRHIQITAETLLEMSNTFTGTALQISTCSSSCCWPVWRGD